MIHWIVNTLDGPKPIRRSHDTRVYEFWL